MLNLLPNNLLQFISLSRLTMQKSLTTSQTIITILVHSWYVIYPLSYILLVRSNNFHLLLFLCVHSFFSFCLLPSSFITYLILPSACICICCRCSPVASMIAFISSNSFIPTVFPLYFIRNAPHTQVIQEGSVVTTVRTWTSLDVLVLVFSEFLHLH
jgi:hypothetical protein